MAAYDPKRPRPAELADDPPPVAALLETGEGPDTIAAGAAAREAAEVPADVAATARQVSGDRSVGVRHGAEVPVAPAPEVGTTNRAVLYASLGAAAVLVAVLVLLRLRRRPLGDPSSGG